MTPCTRRLTFMAVLVCVALPAWGQNYLLYTPQPAPSGQKPPTTQEGILVKEIEIQKGDTLYGLSRKFSGHGTYFPQILLFNAIKNPDLIYSGKSLRVPISNPEQTDAKSAGTSHLSKAHKKRKSSNKVKISSSVQQSETKEATATLHMDLPVRDLEKSGSNNTIGRSKKKTADQGQEKFSQKSVTVTPASQPLPQTVPDAEQTSAQKLFETAVKAYRKDDCRTALELLDRFLANNSGSPLAADANLYKAECYMKLSAQ